MVTAPHRASDLTENKMEAILYFMTWSQESHSTISSMAYWLHRSVLLNKREDCISKNTGGGNHQSRANRLILQIEVYPEVETSGMKTTSYLTSFLFMSSSWLGNIKTSISYPFTQQKFTEALPPARHYDRCWVTTIINVSRMYPLEFNCHLLRWYHWSTIPSWKILLIIQVWGSLFYP